MTVPCPVCLKMFSEEDYEKYEDHVVRCSETLSPKVPTNVVDGSEKKAEPKSMANANFQLQYQQTFNTPLKHLHMISPKQMPYLFPKDKKITFTQPPLLTQKSNSNSQFFKKKMGPQIKINPQSSSKASSFLNLKIPEIFRPTEEQFADPMKYIASIREKGEKTGIVKIIPPSDKWLQNKPFGKIISQKNFVFPTKIQSIHQLLHRNGPNAQFLANLEKFLKKKNSGNLNIPTLDGVQLDLYKLYKSVTNRGGLQQVIRNKEWQDVADDLHISADCTSSSNSLKQFYYKYLYAFELSEKKNAMQSPVDKKKIEEEEEEMNSNEMKLEQENMSEEKKSSPSNVDEFGYEAGKMFTMTSFKKMANQIKKKYFPDQSKGNESEIENEYWRLVENGEDFVQVHYGSDLPVNIYGSGFPKDPEFLETASGWNLNKFAKTNGSILKHIGHDIAGVIQPMMYIGMLFSTFCWHTEDNYLYSINYMHHGSPKTWYGVPAHAAEEFEAVMKKIVPEAFEAHEDLLFLLVTMLSPRSLVENQVPVYRFTQYPGEFVVTFPKAYHAGFSHGFNCAESCNFALDDWYPFGRECVERYRKFSRSSVFSFDEIVCNAAKSPESLEEARNVLLEVVLLREREHLFRNYLFKEQGFWKSMRASDFGEEVKECDVCKYDCYLSGIVCPCFPEKVVCLQHHNQLCSCPNDRKFVYFRYTISEMDTIIASLSNYSKIPVQIVLDFIHEIQQNQYGRVIPKETSKKPSGSGNLGKRKEITKSPLEIKQNHLSPSALKILGRNGGLKQITGIDYRCFEEDGMCVVEKILDFRDVNYQREYLVKWHNFPNEESTWLPSTEIVFFPVLETFEKLHVPKTNKRKARSSPPSTERTRIKLIKTKM